MPTPTINNVLRYPNLPILNQIGKGSSAAAYSLRKLASGITYPIRVRRSNDNAELDIPFCGNGICTSSLLSFVGANSAYVTTWYDQSGNGNHATQTTAGYQPRIVNAGIIDRDFDTNKANTLWPTFASASGVTFVSNGDFSNTTGWSGTGENLSSTNNTLSCTCTGTSNVGRADQTTSTALVANKRLFIRAKVKVTNTSCSNIWLRLRDQTGLLLGTVQQVSTPSQNTQYTLSGIITIPTSFTGNSMISIQHDYADASTANGKVMEVQEVVAIDVTEYGRPSIYFDGTNDSMSIANTTSANITSAPLMINSVFKGETQVGYIICKNDLTSSDYQYAILHYYTNTRIDLGLEGAIRQTTGSGTAPINIETIYTGTYDNGVESGYLNGLKYGADGNYNGSLTTRNYLKIGARSASEDGNSVGAIYKGYISEILLVRSTSQRSKLERNQGKYYSISVS